MPLSINPPVSSGLFPISLAKKFAESHSVLSRLNEYHDGTTHRQALVNSSRRSWKLAHRLAADEMIELRDFWEVNRAQAFSFPNPFETTPPFSRRGPAGNTGLYLVRFASDWTQTLEMVRGDAQVELIEVAAEEYTDLDPEEPPGAGTTEITSTVLSILSSHTLGGTYSAQARATNGLPLGAVAGILFGGPSVITDSSAWTLRTDTYNNPLNTGPLYTPMTLAEVVVSLWVSGSVIGSTIPPDEFFVYDCSIEVTFGDSSTQTWRPTSQSVQVYSGTVTDPGNAIDSDPTTFATVSGTDFGGVRVYTTLQLSGFAISG